MARIRQVYRLRAHKPFTDLYRLSCSVSVPAVLRRLYWVVCLWGSHFVCVERTVRL